MKNGLDSTSGRKHGNGGTRKTVDQNYRRWPIDNHKLNQILNKINF
uniref:(California timema) hypothetical protein n=1 Tax=Timema californicum TaxID=61474 RepID=A0A7R9JJS0_TIMCA|nr:unnamed protein product [Timema californicum]